MTNFNCPNCGSSVETILKLVKMTTCSSCGTTLFLEDKSARVAGHAGVMHDAPMLFGLNDQVLLGQEKIDVKGHARFSYGRGFWDEFWGQSSQGTSVWISVDEGDVVLQEPVPESDWPKQYSRRIGDEISCLGSPYTVTEIESAKCVAVRGSFDEQLFVGESYLFLNAQRSKDLLSAEIWDGGESWFVGKWLDPFEVSVNSIS